MELADIKGLIEKGAKKKRETSIERLERDISTRSDELTVETSKLSSAKIEMERLERKRSELQHELAKLNDLSQFLTSEEYKAGKTRLAELINEADEKVVNQTETIADLETNMGRQRAELDRLKDKHRSYTDPKYEPKYPQHLNIETMLQDCDPTVVSVYRDVDILETEIPTRFIDDGEADVQGIILKMKVVGAILRKVQDQLIDSEKMGPVEEMVMRESFRKVGSIVRKHCGTIMIDPMSRRFKTNWDNYIEQQKGLLTSHLHRKDMQNGHAASPAKPRAKAPQRETTSDLLVSDMIEKGVMGKLANKRISIFGGYERPEILSWMVKVFNLKSAKWYEYGRTDESGYKRLASSLSSASTDVLVIFTVAGHPSVNKLRSIAKARNIPVIMSDSISKTSICYKLSYILSGVQLEENINSIRRG